MIDAALDSLASGGGRRLDFGVADARAWEVGLSCGGRIAVLVTPVAATGLPPGSVCACRRYRVAPVVNARVRCRNRGGAGRRKGG